ncbi:hypothetical protein PHMEG_00030430, partial [Phytophthora megakarya]
SDGAPMKCAGVHPNSNGSSKTLEPSRFLITDWTQKGCSAADSLVEKDNEKCCHVADSRYRDFGRVCEGQLAES